MEKRGNILRAARLCVYGGMAVGALTVTGQVVEYPIYGRPEWYQVTSAGGGVVVKSLSTHQPIGVLQPQQKFLAFGVNAKWVTLGMNGRIGYVPANTSAQLYPKPEESSTEWRATGPTLEEQAAEQKEEASKRANARGLSPSFSNTPTPRPTVTPMTAVGVGGGGRGGGRDEAI